MVVHVNYRSMCTLSPLVSEPGLDKLSTHTWRELLMCA